MAGCPHCPSLASIGFGCSSGLCVLVLASGSALWAPGNVGNAPGPSGNPQDQWAGTQSGQQWPGLTSTLPPLKR